MTNGKPTDQSTRRFVLSAVTPVAKVGRLAQWVALGVTALTLIGIGTFLQPWAWVALFALSTLLATWAGVRLQRENDARVEPAFSARPEYRPHRQNDLRGKLFREETKLWVVVTNDGPSAEFVGRIHSVKGVDQNGDYRVDAVAWEYGRDQARYRIERAGNARLRIGHTRRAGSEQSPSKEIRFNIPHAGMWGSGHVHGQQGVGKKLSHGERVTFILDVVNVTADRQRQYRAVLLFNDDWTVTDFSLEELRASD